MAGVICLANDELGYILPAEDFRFPLNPFKPGKHYEETNSISKEIGTGRSGGRAKSLIGEYLMSELAILGGPKTRTEPYPPGRSGTNATWTL